MRNYVLLLGLLVVMIESCSQDNRENDDQPSTTSLRFIGEYVVPFDFHFKGDLVGGLSGIDYDPVSGNFYIISDNRGEHGNIRFYTTRIDVDASGIHDIAFTGVTHLKNSDNGFYDASKQHGNPDPEAIRWNAKKNCFYWTSEGERTLSGANATLLNPSINLAGIDGAYIGALPTPNALVMQSKAVGPRQNGTLEGITFDADYANLYVSCEEPLYQDSQRADTISNGAVTRLFQFDVASGKNVAQYAYPLEPVAFPPSGKNKFRVNGIAEILYLPGRDKLLTVERSFSMGRLACTVKLFITDLSKADNVMGHPSLKGKNVVMAEKTLLLNLDDLGIHVDNIEGITFGPTLPNGNRSLILVADNNFNWFQLNQFLLFELTTTR